MLFLLAQILLYTVLCFALSAASQLLYIRGIIDTSDYFEYCMLLIAALAIFITCVILLLRKHYSKLDNQRSFFIITYSAYGIFALISFICYAKMGDGVLYATLFNMLQLMKFSVRGVNTITAVVLTHSFMLILIAFMPIINELTLRSPKRKRNKNRISMGIRITDEKNAIKSVKGDGTMVSADTKNENSLNEHSKQQGTMHSHHRHSHSNHSTHSSHSHSQRHSSHSGHHSHHSSHKHR